MPTEMELKQLVKEKYSQIANQDPQANACSCCGATASSCGDEVYNIMSEDYTQLQGYNPEADLGLGCGLPTEFAKLKEGDTVLDLGSGAGNDIFIARRIVGEKGRLIGVDFSETMVEKARANAANLKLENVDFRLGDIEHLPVENNEVDVVLSNCVLNLVPNKNAVFSEIFRVLKPGAHFSISDIVLEGQLPQKLQQAAEMYAGCVSGAIQRSRYLDIIRNAGFRDVFVQKEKKIDIPDSILLDHITPEELVKTKQSDLGIYSITVFAMKPAACCEPGSGCC